MSSITATARLFLLSLGLGATLSCAMREVNEKAPNQASEPVAATTFSTRGPGALAGELVRFMRAGIETRSPNHSFFGPLDEGRSGAPFDGSYDWHSAVIAHWALLVHARTAADEGLEAWLMERLDLEALAHHASLLDRRARAAASPGEADRKLLVARMTFPYDEGWFLMLLAERAKRIDGLEVQRIREAVERRLLDALEERPFPENLGLGRAERQAGQERYCGFYGSSLFLYVQLRWAGSITARGSSRLDQWREETLAPREAGINAVEDPHGYDFLWPPALLALANEVDPQHTQSDYEPPVFDGWPDSVRVATVHVLGMELSRVWPMTVTPLDYAERVDALLARDDLWREDFAACSHWIPQFLFIGEWLRRGRP